MKRVLFLVDEHRYGESAVDFSLSFLKGTEIRLVMVSTRPDMERLEKLSSRLREAGNKVRTEVLKEGYAPVLKESKEGYDLVIFERKEETFRHGILSGVAEAVRGPPVVRILESSGAPVLRIVQESKALEKILILVDGSEGSFWAVEDGKEIAKLAGAEVTVLTVVPPLPAFFTGLEEMEEHVEEMLHTRTTEARTLRRAVRMLVKLGVEARLKIRHGDALEEILEEIGSGYYDLGVLGTRRLVSRTRYILGSIAQEILSQTKMPLLLVKIG
ncbi:MAG: universal stress protein [Candidatus Geothermarchaeales archaeon]